MRPISEAIRSAGRAGLEETLVERTRHHARTERSRILSGTSPSFPAVEVAVGIILVIASVTLLVHLTSTDGEFSRYNLQWNGTSVVFDTLEARGSVMVHDPAELQGRQNATLLVIAPARVPTAEEGMAYRNFVAAGNTLVLGDDFGSGNGLLRAIGASSRLESGDLSSYSREFQISTAPLGRPVEERPLVAGISKIVFNHPVAVENGEPLITTSYLSWVDENGDGRADSTEPLNRFSVMTEESVGDGRVIVIGDASLFINAMQGLPDCDNPLLMRRLLEDTTLVDQTLSRTADAEGPISTFLWVREIPSLAVLVTMLSLAVVAWSLIRRNK